MAVAWSGASTRQVTVPSARGPVLSPHAAVISDNSSSAPRAWLLFFMALPEGHAVAATKHHPVPVAGNEPGFDVQRASGCRDLDPCAKIQAHFHC
jgi:hypothetical protein